MVPCDNPTQSLPEEQERHEVKDVQDRKNKAEVGERMRVVKT